MSESWRLFWVNEMEKWNKLFIDPEKLFKELKFLGIYSNFNFLDKIDDFPHFFDF